VISEGKLKTAQEIAHLGSWEYDQASRMLSWSDEVFRMYGYEPASFNPTIEFYISTSHPDQLKDIQQLLSVNGDPYSFVNRIYTVDGRLRYIQTIGRSLSDGTQDSKKIIGTMQDITEQKNLQDQLLEKTKGILRQYEFARQAELLRNVSTWQWNVTTGAIFWSENLFRMLGFEPYSFEPSYEKVISMVHPEDVEIVTHAIKVMTNSDYGIMPIVECRILSKDGKIKYLRAGGRIVKGKTDHFVTGTVYDITDFVSLRKKTNSNQQLLQTIIDLSTDAISIFDNTLRCLVWNNASAELYGKPTTEVIGLYLYDVMPQLNNQETIDLIANIINDHPMMDSDNSKIETGNLSIELSPAKNIVEDKTGLLLITKRIK
jgi:PAS domain S-box-containing protein